MRKSRRAKPRAKAMRAGRSRRGRRRGKRRRDQTPPPTSLETGLMRALAARRRRDRRGRRRAGGGELPRRRREVRRRARRKSAGGLRRQARHRPRRRRRASRRTTPSASARGSSRPTTPTPRSSRAWTSRRGERGYNLYWQRGADPPPAHAQGARKHDHAGQQAAGAGEPVASRLRDLRRLRQGGGREGAISTASRSTMTVGADTLTQDDRDRARAAADRRPHAGRDRGSTGRSTTCASTTAS